MDKDVVIRSILQGEKKVWKLLGLDPSHDTVQNQFLDAVRARADRPGLALILGLDYLDNHDLPAAKEWMEYSSQIGVGDGYGYLNLVMELYASRLASLRGDVFAQGLEPNPVLEKAYLHRAAEKGNEVAMLLLGELAFQVEDDLKEALRYWRMGVGKGNAECALSMAFFFAVHRRQINSSLRWFLTAWKLKQRGGACWIYTDDDFWPQATSPQHARQLTTILGKLRDSRFRIRDYPTLSLQLIKWARPCIRFYNAQIPQ